MSQGDILDVFRTTIFLILQLAAPMLFVSILIGLLISIFQAATQIHEQTLTFVPKLFVIALVLIVAGSWILTKLVEFFTYIMNIMVGL